MFAGIGASGLDLAEVSDRVLDDKHTLVRTSWAARLDHPASDVEPLVLESSLLLRREEDRWRIVVYLNHRDVAALIAERCGA